MSVVQLRADSAEPVPGDFIPAIRTPEQFLATHRRIGDLLSNLRLADDPGLVDAIREVTNLKRAMNDSPFCLLGGEVQPCGFHPRVISRLD